MSDPIDDLRNLAEGGPVPPHRPAHEVRRRGDRLRRRRYALHATGAALAVAAAVSGGLLVNQSLTGSTPPPVSPPAPSQSPTPSPSPDSEPAALIEIPDGFPLDLQLPDPEPGEPTDPSPEAPGITDLEPCGAQVLPAPRAEPTDRLAVGSERPGEEERRELVLYRSADEAGAVLDGVEAALDSCPEESADGTTFLWSYLEAEDATLDRTLVVTLTYELTGLGPTPGLVQYRLSRSGNALLLLQERSEASAEMVPDVVAAYADLVRPLERELCGLMYEDRCPSDQATSEEGTDLSPEDLPQADDLLPIDGAPAWSAQPTQDRPVLGCQPEALDTLGAVEAVRGDFASGDADGPRGEATASVLRFADRDAAAEAQDVAQGWIDACANRLDEERHPEAQVGAERTVDTVAGPATWREVIALAPDVCAECGAAWFEGQSAVQVDDRLVLVHLGAVAGPLEPERYAQRVAEAVRSAVRAARP